MLKKVSILCFLLSFTVCTNSGETLDYKKVLKDPSLSYRKGHYRNVVEYFQKHQPTTPEQKYMVAASYVELRDYKNAFESFRKIDVDELRDSEYKDLFPFYVRKYLQTLIMLEESDLLTKEEQEKLIENITLVPHDSPIRTYLDKELFSVLWKLNDLESILLLDDNLSHEGKGWLELSKYKLGKDYNVKHIIRAQKSFAKNKAYSNILPTLDPTDFRKANELENLIEMSLRLPEYRDLALEFAKQHEKVIRDKEFYPTVLADYYLLKGQKQDAIQTLTNYIDQNPEASLDFYVYTYEYLVNRKDYDAADNIASLAYQQHQKKFYQKARNSLEFHQNASYVYNWYKDNYKDISEDQHLQVIRALIRKDMNLAEDAVDLGLEKNLKHPSYILMYALIKEHQGHEEEAYRYYLRLIFQEAFGYAGIVAKEKEKKMRDKYRSIFDEVSAEVIKKIPSYALADRLMIAKSLLVDDELEKFVDRKQLKKDQAEFNKIVYKDINSVKNISILEKYPDELQNFAPETQDYVENSVIAAMKGDDDYHNTARYYYKYRDYFINSDIEGYLTFRLYFYIRDQFGYTYLPNYPKDIVELVFPKPEFELITKWSKGDVDLAYWMLSSFMAESHFRKRVYSHVGAVGFAQVMPYTAKDIKRWLKKPYLSNYDFYDNMRMGVYYHTRMYELMNNDVLLSLAAYNAGPNAVKRWQKKYSHLKDIYLFIEAIDYQETRNYVKIINYNHGMYRLLNDYDLY